MNAKLVALVLFGLAALPQDLKQLPMPQGIVLDGYYRCNGTSGEKQYTALVCIKKVKDVYVVNWSFPGGAANGIGFRDGNVMVVASSNNGTLTVIKYDIDNTGTKLKLNGKWTCLPGNGAVAEENLVWFAELEEAKK